MTILDAGGQPIGEIALTDEQLTALAVGMRDLAHDVSGRRSSPSTR
jgi:citrate lyase beta subunit